MKKLLPILILLSIGSLFVGVSDLSPMALLAGDANSWHLMFTSRIPRLVAVILAGAGLSIAGLSCSKSAKTVSQRLRRQAPSSVPCWAIF